MHEYSLVAALVEQVEAQARARGAASARRVEISVGELAGVEVDLLRTAYATFTPGTICARAPLTVREVKAQWCCPRCGRAFSKGEVLRCTGCSLPAQLARGDELTLDRVELEVPDVR